MEKRLPAIKKTVLMLFVTMQFMLNVSAQQTDIGAKFLNYQQASLQEKLFVHTDKVAYLAGEIVWLKIYAADGVTQQPADVSKVAYIDILDNNHVPVMQAKIALKNGSGNGSVYIPVNIGSGNYQLRAYTNWMKNFSADYYFTKTVAIINPLKSPSAPVVAANKPVDFDVQFFPEGGNLVRGISSKVGFKITGTDGRGMNLEGAIVNQQNDTIVKFRPLKFGMGNFMFTPAANNTYRAVIKTGNAKPIVKQLPSVQDQGYVMQVTDIDRDRVEVVVRSNASAGSVFMFVHTRQMPKISETAALTNNTARFVIDKNKLGDGISHITIFNNAQQPVCERLVFKQPAHKLILNAAADQEQYAGRKKVGISISAKNQDNQAVASDLSVAVYKLDSLQKGDESSILSYLWLLSDLRGKIDSADYYFTNPNNQTIEALNNLLLTQGWRRFNWSNVLSSKPMTLKFLPEVDGHLITGKVVNSLTGAPASNILVHMGVPGKRVQYYNSLSDSTGGILFNTTDYYGNAEVILQTDQQIDSTYTLSVNTPFSESFAAYPVPDLKFSAAMLKQMPQLSIGMQAQNIYSGKKQNQFYDPQIDSASFFYSPNKSYLLDNYTRFTTMEEVFREYIADAAVSKSKKKFHLSMYNGTQYMEKDPLMLIDGVPILEVDKAFTIDPLKIKTVEVVPFEFYYGSAVLTGVISLHSYKNDLGGLELDPHAAIVDYEGLQLQRQFYAPAYETAQQADSTIPDFRSTLYWDANAGTDNTGKKAVSFFTSDVNGKYIGVVQGTTANGEAGSTTFTFEVKNAAL